MMIYRVQEEAFGGLDRSTRKLLDGMGQGEKPGTDVKRRLKAGTVLVREYRGERQTVPVVTDGFVWEGATYGSLSTIARAITGLVDIHLPSRADAVSFPAMGAFDLKTSSDFILGALCRRQPFHEEVGRAPFSRAAPLSSDNTVARRHFC
jgi:hypothetical protein